MVGDLLTAVTKNNSGIRRVYDPFAGSGTALTEAMMRGLDFKGQDINPLAVLLCQAKTIPFFDGALDEKLAEVIETAATDAGRSIEADFPGRKKWFENPVSLGLSRLRRAIRSEPALWARRFLWIALAETVRLTSNSRTSTFKLHIRPKEEIESERSSPLDIFERTAKRNIEQLRCQKESLEERGHIERGRYTGTVTVRVADSSSKETPSDATQKCDILVTSPPYGDNITTVPYGQHSYLPLQWIDLTDISPTIDATCLDTTHEIDRRSLGGSKKGVRAIIDSLREKSPTLGRVVDALKDAPTDRANRVMAFCRDLDLCIDPVIKVLKPNAIMIWILGNRRVGGKLVPLDKILSEFLVERGSRSILIINREIPSKRMAVRNSVSATMRTENIVVLRKGGS
jgi:hypothetical protein